MSRSRTATSSAASSVQPPRKTASRAKSALLLVGRAGRTTTRSSHATSAGVRVGHGPRRSSRTRRSVEPLEDLRWRQRLHACGREFERERQVVEARGKSRRRRRRLSKSGLTARARARKKSTPSSWPSGGTEYSCSPVTRSGSRLVTSSSSRGHASSSSARSARRVHDLLEVVEQRAAARLSPMCSASAVLGAERLSAPSRERAPASRSGASGTQKTPSVIVLRRARRPPAGRAGSCPSRPGPVSVSRRKSSRPSELVYLARAPARDQGTASPGRADSSGTALLSGGNSLVAELVDAALARRGPSAGARRDRAARPSPTSAAVEAETSTCPPWPAGGDPRRAVDVDADVALVGQERRPRVDAHPDADRPGASPR